MLRLLITTSSFDLKNFSQIGDLAGRGIQVVLNPYKRKMTESEISELMDDQVIAMIAGTEPLTEAVLMKASSLKVIVRCGIGMDNVDLDAARKLGITVRNTPDAPSRSVAELTIGHILSLLRRIPESDRGIRNGKWKALMGSLLYGQTVGIIGYGRIGKMVATMLGAFGVKVIVFDVMTGMTDSSVRFVDLDTLFKESDIITLHVPYTKENHHLVNKERLRMMKPTSYLVNVSRGGLVDDEALNQVLLESGIAGAALDCYETEPYSGPLIGSDKVQMTAHMGSYASQARIQMEKDSVDVLLNELNKIVIN